MFLLFEEKEKPKDWKFMECSAKVLQNLPNTWKKYPLNEKGRHAIIDMEYNELKNAEDMDTISQELVHLASACLFLWRKLNHAE